MYELTWRSLGKSIVSDGHNITYVCNQDPWLIIQSRKRWIPHSGRPGTWAVTTYHAIYRGHEFKKNYRMKDLKDYLEANYENVRDHY